MSHYRRGDRVRLRGMDGPAMLVAEHTANTVRHPSGQVVCVWHDAIGQPHRAEYPPELLEAVDGCAGLGSLTGRALAR